MTHNDIKAIRFHPSWDDGRFHCLWCRFDAVVDHERLLRAELTWNDDEEPEAERLYFDPILTLETNRLTDDGWKTERTVRIDLTDKEALDIVGRDPKELLERFDKEWATIV